MSWSRSNWVHRALECCALIGLGGYGAGRFILFPDGGILVIGGVTLFTVSMLVMALTE